MSICENLISTYNTNILNKVSEKEKFIWKEVCKFLYNNQCEKKIFNILRNIEIKKNYKKILSDLIYNHFNLQNNPKPNYRYISGPINCSLWTSDKYKKNIYIFGEYHGTEQSCKEYKETKGNFIEIQEYFKQLFVTTDVFIDFYLELQSFKQKEYKNVFTYIDKDDAFLNRIRNTNYKCIDPETRDKLHECKLMRSHYTDIRQYYIKNDFFNFVDFMKYNSNNNYKNIDEYKNIINKINFSKDILEKNIIEIYKNIIKSKYEKNILDSLKGRIDKFIIQKIKNEIQKLDFTNMKRELKNLQLRKKIIPETLKHFLSIINVLIMDSYALYRIFKNFNIKETEKDQPISPHNIIIYAGDSHAYTYRTFLKNIGFINREQVGINLIDYKNNNETITKNLGERCLDMNGDGKKNKITQPLFSFI